jgi:hypothetical protein
MYALRQSYDHAPAHVSVPKELQSQPMELIFLSANETASSTALSDADRKEKLKLAMQSARGCLDTGLTIDQIDAEVRAMRNEWL